MKKLISLVISIILIFFLLSFFDAESIGLLISANLSFVLIALILTGVELLIKAIRWERMLKKIKVSLSFKKILSDYIISIALGNLSPARAGELYRVYSTKLKNTSSFKLLSLIIIEKIIDLSVLVFMVLLFIFFYAKAVSSEILFFFIIFFILFAFFLFFVFVKKSIIKKIMKKTFNFFIKFNLFRKRKQKIRLSYTQFRSGFRTFKLKDFTNLSALTLLTWLINGSVLYLSFLALGSPFDLSLIYAIGFVAIAFIIGTLSTLPGGIGAFEVVLFILFASIGTVQSQAVAVVMLYRILSLGFSLILGGLLIIPKLLFDFRKK